MASPRPCTPEATLDCHKATDCPAGSLPTPAHNFFYLRPAMVTCPLEASLPLRRLAPTVTQWLWHLQPQLATSLV